MPLPPLPIVLLLGALAAVTPLSVDMYLPALPAIAQALATDTATVQLTLAVFFVGSALGQLAWGPLSDRYGRRGPLFAGLGLFVAASLGCAVAQDAGTLVVLRALQALGACATAVIPRALVRDLFDVATGARLLSTTMLVMGVAPILAPSLGGLVLAAGDWHLIFVLLAVFGAGCLVAAWRLMPPGRPWDGRPLDARGVWSGYRELLRDRLLVMRGLAGGFAFGAMFAYITASPGLFIEWIGLTPQAYAWLFGANALGLIACSQVNARLLRTRSPRRLLGGAVLLQGAFGVAMLAAAIVVETGVVPRAQAVWWLLPPLWCFLAVMGCVLPNATVIAMEPFRERAGTASALLGVLQFGLAALVSAATSVAGAWLGKGPLAMGLMMAAAGLLSMTLQRRALRD